MPAAITTPPRGRGRPRKFAGPSRALTLTLPEDTLAFLAALDDDVSHAIVQLVGRQKRPRAQPPPAELAFFGRRAVISVRPTASMERQVGVELVPLPNGRALISFDQPKTIADLELALHDVLDDRTLGKVDRQTFESIRDILRQARRSSEVRLLRRNIIVLEYSGKGLSERAGATAGRDRSRVRS